MAASPHSRAYPNDASPATHAHLTHYWRTRIEDLLEQLEREARRMLQLETELSEFAEHYYATVGEATQRLAAIEAELHGAPLPHDVRESMPDLSTTRHAQAARKTEMKQRYRQLAKEVHPDAAGSPRSTEERAEYMITLNRAYQRHDLAAILRLEAEMLLAGRIDPTRSETLEQTVRELERVTNTYAEAYRHMLHSPLNELMLRAMSARLAGWDWMQAVVRKLERAIEEKERAVIEAGIAQISQWRHTVHEAA